MQPYNFPKGKASAEAQLNALASIGLSQYEGKCFLSSLQTGPATINQIGINAGIPRTKVYGAVRKLVEKGLLVQSEEDEKIFSARPPSEVLIPLLEKEQRRIKQGLESLEELELIYQSMRYVKRTEEAFSSKVVRFSPRNVISKKIQELFQKSKKSVVVLTSANGFIRLSRSAGLLYERSKLGMKLDIFSSARGNEPVFQTALQSIKEIEKSEVVLLATSIAIQVIIVDNKHILISELKPDDLREDGMDVAYLIENSEMAEMLDSLIRLLGTKLA